MSGLDFSSLRLPGGRSIRTKLVLAFGVLLLLGALNTIVYFWGAHERRIVFGELQRAINRLSTITDAVNQLENVSREIRLFSEVIGAEELSPLAPQELDRRYATIDGVTRSVGRMPTIAGAGQDSIVQLRMRIELLGASWKKVYANMWSNPAEAISELVLRAEPLAEALFLRELPGAVASERAQVRRASAAFEQTDRTASRVALFLFVISAAVGGILALVTSRSLLRAVSALKTGVDRLSTGDLTHRIAIYDQDELGLVAASFNQMAERLGERTTEIEEQRKVSESLLLNILPRSIAAELRQNGRVEPKYYADSTILFADFVAFTRLSDQLSVDRMVHLLDDMFTAFDRIAREYRLEKLKTIGDAYLCVGGLTRETASHPVDAVMSGFEMIDVVTRRARAEQLPLAVRIGIHNGPVAAGVVGIDKFAFDVWGNTVNFAARLQSTSEPDRINISSSAYLRVKDFFDCEYRGLIETKERRTFDMYFVNGVHPELVGTGAPPPEFSRRYQIYFERAPTGFPESLAARAPDLLPAGPAAEK